MSPVKMWAQLAAIRADQDGKPYQVGDLVCIELPLNCTVHAGDPAALARLRVAAAQLAAVWKHHVECGDEQDLGAITCGLISQIVEASFHLGDA